MDTLLHFVRLLSLAPQPANTTGPRITIDIPDFRGVIPAKGQRSLPGMSLSDYQTSATSGVSEELRTRGRQPVVFGVRPYPGLLAAFRCDR
jgi:hypothetical protein